MLKKVSKKQKVYIIFVLVLCINLALASILIIQNKKSANLGNPTPTINVSYENFAEVISKNSMIKALPKDEKILLRFYDFNSGERTFDKSYYLSAGRIEETKDESAEIVVLMHSKYMNGLTNKNLCSTFKKANQNRDFGIESSLSDVKMAWKFRALMKYKDCF